MSMRPVLGIMFIFGVTIGIVGCAARDELLESAAGPFSTLGEPLPWIRASDDGSHFVADTGGSAETETRPFIVWGVNYDHDDDGRLLEDYWSEQWSTVVEDFYEIRDLGANVIRIHLQVAQFMASAEDVNEANLGRLADLVLLSERLGLYLDVTGLGCYHKRDVPTWYDTLDEAARWEVQARFWRAVAGVCKDSPAVFCYDLMNEPILPGATPETDWLAGEFAGKHFVQRIALDLDGRTRAEVAEAWVSKLASAVREVDDRHMITVGVIPWAHTFPGAKPVFYAPNVGGSLDFVSVHFYPKKDENDAALVALAVYEIGKPLVVEEIFPLASGLEQTAKFIDESRAYVDGWISFYWGATIEENEQKGDIAGAIVAAWLRYFRDRAPEGEE